MNGYNIKFPMTDADETGLTTDLNSLKTKLLPFKPSVDATHLAHIKPEGLEVLEQMVAYVEAHPTALPGTISLEEFEQIVDMAIRFSHFEARVDEIKALVASIAQAARDFGFATSRQVYRIEEAKGRNADNSAILDSFGQRFAHVAHAAAPAKNKPA